MEERGQEQKSNMEFESDTQKIIRRHLENEKDEITDEDIRNVRVGMSPPLDEGVPLNETEFKKTLETNDGESKGASDEPITPWDTLNENE